MKPAFYALTVSIVAATYLSRDADRRWLDACYTERPDAVEGAEAGLDVDAQIHWGSGLPCFTVFYVGQLMLALAHRRANSARSLQIG